MAEFRGRPCCSCQVLWLPAFEAEAQRRGLLDGPLPISQLIGGAAASGGTHSTGGAADLYPLTHVHDIRGLVRLARDMGADATWLRPYNWDSRKGVEHIHSVLTGCPHNGPARYQISAVGAGFNGLGSGGRGAPDDGPRPLSGRTWQEGIEWARQQAEDDMAMSEDDWARLEKLLDARLDAAEDRIKYESPSGQRVSRRKWFEGFRKAVQKS